MSAWQPIETAPRDGTRILIYYAAPGSTVKQQWSANVRGHFIRIARWDDGKWRLDMSGHFRLDATHWMHLPALPKEGETQP